jgi:Beta-lactamase class C and other penicillin binding proteins
MQAWSNMEWRQLEAFILEKMSEYKMPSVTIAVVKNGEVVYANALGFRDLERGVSATPATVYGIGSITKTFTSLCVLKQVEEGRLDLNDYVEKYIPTNLRPFGEPVKIWHLLTHSSGLPALGYAEAFIEGVMGLGAAWMPIAKPQDLLPFLEGGERLGCRQAGEAFLLPKRGLRPLGFNH